MARVRRRVKATAQELVTESDLIYLELGLPPRLSFREEGRAWLTRWAKRWPREGVELLEGHPENGFEFAIDRFGDPRRRTRKDTPK